MEMVSVDFDALLIKITMNCLKFFFLSVVYFSPRSNLDKYNSFFDHFQHVEGSMHGSTVFICGDYNILRSNPGFLRIRRTLDNFFSEFELRKINGKWHP